MSSEDSSVDEDEDIPSLESVSSSEVRRENRVKRVYGTCSACELKRSRRQELEKEQIQLE